MKDRHKTTNTDAPAARISANWWRGLVSYIKAKRDERAAKKKQEAPADKAARKTSAATIWIAIFTSALAAIAFYQFFILKNQLEVMRKDQRPWLKLEFTLNNLVPGQPITATMHMVNNGKTPARVIFGDAAIERVKNGELARLNYPLPHSRFTSGLLFPNAPVDIPIGMLRESVRPPEKELLTQSELEDFEHLRILFVIYATVHYKDFFGVGHWTRFCTVEVIGNVAGTFIGQNCTDYSDVDEN